MCRRSDYIVPCQAAALALSLSLSLSVVLSNFLSSSSPPPPPLSSSSFFLLPRLLRGFHWRNENFFLRKFVLSSVPFFFRKFHSDIFPSLVSLNYEPLHFFGFSAFSVSFAFVLSFLLVNNPFFISLSKCLSLSLSLLRVLSFDLFCFPLQDVNSYWPSRSSSPCLSLSLSFPSKNSTLNILYRSRLCSRNESFRFYYFRMLPYLWMHGIGNFGCFIPG